MKIFLSFFLFLGLGEVKYVELQDNGLVEISYPERGKKDRLTPKEWLRQNGDVSVLLQNRWAYDLNKAKIDDAILRSRPELIRSAAQMQASTPPMNIGLVLAAVLAGFMLIAYVPGKR